MFGINTQAWLTEYERAHTELIAAAYAATTGIAMVMPAARPLPVASQTVVCC